MRTKTLIVSIVAFFTIQYAGYCKTIKDTIPAPNVKSYRFNYDFTALDSIPIDTFLARFQIYNPAFENLALNNFLGNLSAPYQSSLLSDRNGYNDFVFAQSTQYYIHQPYNTIYYDARHPYTIISYFANFPGMKDEQMLHIVHTQNVNRNLNLGANININNSVGKYLNQQNVLNAASLFSSYHGKRYSFNASANLNKLKVNENGGIQSDSSYENNSSISSIDLPVNLLKASSLLKDQSISLFQRFYITGSYKLDSLRTSSKWNEALSLIHQFTYKRTTRSFTDDLASTQDSSYYKTNFKYSDQNVFGFNRSNTYDSVAFRRIENTLQIVINTNQWLKVPAELRFGIRNQIDRIRTYSLDSVTKAGMYLNNTTSDDYQKSIINNSFVGSLTNRFSKSISWGASGELYFTGYKSGDLLLQGDIRQSIKHNFIMSLSGKFETFRPGYFMNYYNSNNFQWNNKFNQQQNSSVKLGIYHLKRKFYIDVRWDNLNKYVYFDESAKPKVANNVFMTYSVSVSKLIDWGIFHSNIRITYQRSENETAISIPEWSGFTSNYLGFAIFNKELKIQFGFDFYCNSRYYANSYSPATSVFYAQDKILIGNYPNTDLFLNFKIKRTRFFFKYEHLDKLITNRPEYLIPHYPINPPLVKFGISWTFYD